MFAAGLQYLTDRAIDRSQAAVREDDLDAAAGAAQDAIDLEPWAAEPRIQLGLVYRSAGDYDAAKSSLQAAIQRADEDWRPWASLALVELVAGDSKASCHAVHVARSLNPKQELLRRPIRGLDCGNDEPLQRG
jgi:Tfp pilus assembly protein PilF